MGVQNLDVQFEDYIIFHRGVQQVYFETEGEEANHLFVVYQDGYKQDLGDPLGDRVANAETLNQTTTALKTELKALEATLREELTEATDAKEDAMGAYQTVQDMREGIEANIEAINGRLDVVHDGITGLSKDETSGQYYVDLSDYSTTTETESLINTGIEKIEGITSYTDGNGEKVYYLDPLQNESKTTNAVNAMINERLVSVNGIHYDDLTQAYYVKVGDTAIAEEEIHAMFA